MAAMTMIFVLTAEPVALSGEAWAAAAVALGAAGATGDGAGTTAKLDLVDLSAREAHILIDLKVGTEAVTVWTNDLTHDYVHENSAYST